AEAVAAGRAVRGAPVAVDGLGGVREAAPSVMAATPAGGETRQALPARVPEAARSEVPAARAEAEAGVDIPHPQAEEAHAAPATLRLRSPEAEPARPHPQDDPWPAPAPAVALLAEQVPWPPASAAGPAAREPSVPAPATAEPAGMWDPSASVAAGPSDAREASVPALTAAGPAEVRESSVLAPSTAGPSDAREASVPALTAAGPAEVRESSVLAPTAAGPADAREASVLAPTASEAAGVRRSAVPEPAAPAGSRDLFWSEPVAVLAPAPAPADGAPADGGIVPGPGIVEAVARAVARMEEDDTQDLPRVDAGRGITVTEVPVHLPFRGAAQPQAPGRAPGQSHAQGQAQGKGQPQAPGQSQAPSQGQPQGQAPAQFQGQAEGQVRGQAQDHAQDHAQAQHQGRSQAQSQGQGRVLLPGRIQTSTPAPTSTPTRTSTPTPTPTPGRAPAAARSAPGRRVPRGDDRLREHHGPVLPGWIGVAVGGFALAGCTAVLWRAGAVPDSLAYAFGAEPRPYRGLQARFWPPLAFLGVVALLALGGLGRGRAGHAWVLTLFGRYRGTVRRSGLTWISPLLLRRRVDVRLRHWRSDPMPAVDSGGLALQVVVQVVWQVKDTARATLAVADHVDYLAEQVESAMARVLSQLPADAFHEDAPTLRDAEAVGDALTRMLAAETEAVGVEVFSAQPTRIEYAPEVAEAMRRRRVAAIDAKHRDTVLSSVVDAVDDTVHRLTSRGLVELDDYERKALVKDLTVAFYTGRAE
ncbi:SPFH domain-containing protein, partial [Streptomyces sp. ISL-66]|uniref:SPFH domain-containing protein n=1 Tax=Streptomyces sp. ISL-66 TaxID=2819186 RepID=UPI0027E57602